MGLFSDDFGTINTDEELASMQNQFPFYDPAYICQAAVSTRIKTKEWMEKLWTEYEPYADKDFLPEFKRRFTQRSWELYLGATLLSRGFNLKKNTTEGPNFEIQSKGGKTLTWIEAITVTKGEGIDKVPEMSYGVVQNIPIDQISLRLSSALKEKHEKYLTYIKNGIVKPGDPYIIALDRSECGLGDPYGPQILSVLFGIGDPALRMRVGDKPVENPEVSWTHQPLLNKRNGKGVPMLFFEDPGHAGISAVIYTKDHVINSPRNPQEMGENVTIIHNPNAKYKLADNFFPFGTEYKASEGYVNRIRDKKDYVQPDPFEYLEQ